MFYDFLDAVIFTYIESGSIVTHQLVDDIGDDFRYFETKFSYLIFYFCIYKIVFVVYKQNYKNGKIAIADVGKLLNAIDFGQNPTLRLWRQITVGTP